MCGATRENASSRWTVHWTIGPFFNQMLNLVVKAGKSWKPVRSFFPGQMCENTGSSPAGSTFSYRKTRRSAPASRLIPNATSTAVIPSLWGDAHGNNCQEKLSHVSNPPCNMLQYTTSATTTTTVAMSRFWPACKTSEPPSVMQRIS